MTWNSTTDCHMSGLGTFHYTATARLPDGCIFISNVDGIGYVKSSVASGYMLMDGNDVGAP